MEPRLVTPKEAKSPEWTNDHEAAQNALIDEVDRLENEYGVTSERLIDLYGESVFDTTSPVSGVVARWARLCDTLTTTDKSMVALVSARQPNYHACYPTDLPGSKRPILSMLIITDPHAAGIAFDREPHTRSVQVVAEGYRLKQPGPTTPVQPRFDDLTAAPQPLDDVIASSINNFTVIDNDLGDQFEIVVAGNTYTELHDAIIAAYYQRHPFPSAAIEHIEYDPSMARLIQAELPTNTQTNQDPQPSES